MKSSLRYVVIAGFLWVVILLAFGCTQHDDVIQSTEKSTLTLEPSFLPELDEMYAYQLWMVSVPNEGDDITAAGAVFTSIRKFLWDNSIHVFRDLAGNVLENKVDLPKSWFAYDYIVVSIEPLDDPLPDQPSGTYLLVDEVVNQETRPISLRFPVSMFAALGFYFVGTPTNNIDTIYYDPDSSRMITRRIRNDENKGLWLCSRALSQRNLHDTLGVNALDVVVVPDTFDTIGMGDPDTIRIVWPEDSTWAWDTVNVVFGYDTLWHRRINIEWVDTVDSFYDYILFPNYEIDSIPTQAYPHQLGTIGYYEYLAPLEGLPDISAFGWRYNTWLILDQSDPTGNENMDLAPIVPFGDGTLTPFTGQNEWGVLPLGAFNNPALPDLSNPYISNREVPQFPGEDFVVNASPRFDDLNLRLISTMAWGFVIVGMEPDPAKLPINNTTNFPLMILSSEIPSGDNPATNFVQLFHNWSQFLPEIAVTVEMHE